MVREKKSNISAIFQREITSGVTRVMAHPGFWCFENLQTGMHVRFLSPFNQDSVTHHDSNRYLAHINYFMYQFSKGKKKIKNENATKKTKSLLQINK